MAKLIKYLFIIMSATYFLFAGTGYNVVKYCCKGCQTEKINSFCNEKLILKSKPECCAKKVENTINKEIIGLFNHNSKTCQFFRVMLDVPVINTINLLTTHYVRRINLYYLSTQISINQHQSIYSEIYPPPNNKSVISGREILALKAVLII
jgi:hypothetical protein